MSRAGVCPAVGRGDFEQPSYVTESKLIPEAVPRLDTGAPYRAIRDFPFNFRLIIIMGAVGAGYLGQRLFRPPPHEHKNRGGKPLVSASVFVQIYAHGFHSFHCCFQLFARGCEINNKIIG